MGVQPSLRFVVAGALALGVPFSIHASREGFTTPDWRGAPGASYQGWEVFTVATDEGVGNGPDLPGSTPAATLTQTSPDAFLTGSGNIYSPAGISSFAIRYTSPVPVGTVVLQTRTLGSELDYSSVRISYDLGSGMQFLTAARTENDRGTLLGASVSSQWEWNLAGTGATSYDISFIAAGTSLSFDAATLDTRSAGVVPEPSTWALIALGAFGLAGTFRRTRRG